MGIFATIFGFVGSAGSTVFSAVSFLIGIIWNWFKHFYMFFVIEALFRVFFTVGWLQDILWLAWYFENLALFKFLTEPMVTYMMSLLTIVLSLEVLHLLMQHKTSSSTKISSHK